MTIRPKYFLSLSALSVSLASSLSFAQLQSSSVASITPVAASAQTAVPALVPFSGIAVDREGRALSSETAMTFLLFKDQTGGEPIYTETQTVVPYSDGHYTVRLGSTRSSGIPLDLFGSGEVRWLEVQVTGQPTQPRTLFTSVPYALKAADAATLGGYPASAFVLAGQTGQSSSAPAGVKSAITPAAVTNVTTSLGGKPGTIPTFTTSNNIESSNIFVNATGLGIGRLPAAMLDVNGNAVIRGSLGFSRSADATTTKAFPSFPFYFQSSVHNSSSNSNVLPFFQIETEPTGNNTASTGATMNFLYYSGIGGAGPQETGFFLNPNGTLHFSPAQIFPGGTGTGNAVCIAANGGFGGGGTTFIAPNFTVPAGGGCTAWSGFTKTASTVVLTTGGTGCVSTDGKKLTLSVTSADPDFLGVGTIASDYIQLTRPSATGTFTSGSDEGYFNGSAVQTSCTASLLQLDENND
ncbi:hypothetical protein HDF16_003638 [Granulicella aggregans]|uniref:Uncharacterized protein n=1 Tax=Granulicella aggregans TaxID=474949 RepID=A0A7W7ZFD8_9BACT|nr:hypothetical protein [Granulicella aggregans]MBB5058915.1 hypothetical protein [Granulicella aggregans]